MKISAEQKKLAQSLMKKHKKSHVYVTKDNKMFFSKTGALIQCNDIEEDMVKVDFEAKKVAPEVDTETTTEAEAIKAKQTPEVDTETTTVSEAIKAELAEELRKAVNTEAKEADNKTKGK